MKILQFLSFGSWQTYVEPGKESLFTVAFVAFCILLGLKAAGLWLFDADRRITETATEQIIVVISRILHVSLYFLGMMGVAMIGNIQILTIALILGCLYILIVGIVILVSEKDPYLFWTNKWYHDFIVNTFVRGKVVSKEAKKAIKNINLKINDYTRNSKF